MQQLESKYPKLIIREGHGTFSSMDISFEADFEICHYPQKTIIKTECSDNNIGFKLIKNQSELWIIDGVIDNGIPVYSKSLLFNGNSRNKLSFLSFTDLHFGQDINSTIMFADFPLVGIYDLSFQTEIESWSIECSGDKKELTEIKTNSKNWNLQFEGNILRIKKQGTTKDEYLTKANNITSLLSLASGNDVAFNRQLYHLENEQVTEEWRRKVDYHFGAERCIPDFCLNEFLTQTLTNFEKWDKDKKKIFFSTVNYINSSSKGYLEDRLLRIGIAWEALAQSWGTKMVETKSEDLISLKNQLKKTITEFNLPIGFEKDFLITRVIGSLDWEKNTNKLISLADKYKLDVNKMGLDFKQLNKIRNDVAHTGLFRKKPSNNILTDLLYKHKAGLQILLLLELGYNNLIESEENKWSKIIKINELLES